MMKPIVSIVIPTYERPELLDRLLRSIAQQTYRDFEVIVVDDASSCCEANLRVIGLFGGIFDCLRYVCNRENMGAPWSRNRGIELAQGELIAFVDDDDEWMSEKLHKQVQLFLQSSDKLGIVYTWTQAVKDERVCWEYKENISGHAIREILTECFIPSPSVLVRRSALYDAGLFDPFLPSCQDWDMWTRILEKGYHCDVVPSFLTIYHKHNLPTIGGSPKATLGYNLYETKHLHLYRRYHPFRYLKKLVKRGIKAFQRSREHV